MTRIAVWETLVVLTLVAQFHLSLTFPGKLSDIHAGTVAISNIGISIISIQTDVFVCKKKKLHDFFEYFARQLIFCPFVRQLIFCSFVRQLIFCPIIFCPIIFCPFVRQVIFARQLIFFPFVRQLIFCPFVRQLIFCPIVNILIFCPIGNICQIVNILSYS